MTDTFFLGLFVGTVLGPVVLVVVFLCFAVWTSRVNRKDRMKGHQS